MTEYPSPHITEIVDRLEARIRTGRPKACSLQIPWRHLTSSTMGSASRVTRAGLHYGVRRSGSGSYQPMPGRPSSTCFEYLSPLLRAVKRVPQQRYVTA